MKLANVDGRAFLLTGDDTGLDVAAASEGVFGPDLEGIYREWDRFTSWAAATRSDGEVQFSRDQLGSPSPTPRQIIAIGLNYSEHAAESGFTPPQGLLPIFTKFVSALTGPDAEVVIPPGGNVDWEVELVAIIGRTASRVTEDQAWDHVAGLTIGQDISERVSQLAGPTVQPGQVVPELRAGRPVVGDARRGPRQGRSRTGLHCGRGTDAGRTNPRSDLPDAQNSSPHCRAP